MAPSGQGPSRHRRPTVHGPSVRWSAMTGAAALVTAVRHCQWQLSGARLGLRVSPTTPQRFRQDHPQEPTVAGLGDAFCLSNHLFVRNGRLQLDVYASTSDGTAADHRLAEAAAAKVLSRL